MSILNPLMTKRQKFSCLSLTLASALLVRWFSGKAVAAKPDDLLLIPGTHMVEEELVTPVGAEVVAAGRPS